MNYLVINTAGKTEILLEADKTYYYASDNKALVSETLLLRIETMLKGAGITLSDIDIFGCVVGPGSFTGIRIGVSTIRAFCYGLDRPAVPVTYFDCIAYNSTADDAADGGTNKASGEPLTVVIDGGNRVCYLQNYPQGFRGENNPEPLCVRYGDIPLFAAENACHNIAADTIFMPELGIDGCRVYKADGAGLRAAFKRSLVQKGACRFNELVPLYLRRSQPEREAGEL